MLFPENLKRSDDNTFTFANGDSMNVHTILFVMEQVASHLFWSFTVQRSFLKDFYEVILKLVWANYMIPKLPHLSTRLFWFILFRDISAT